MVRSQSASSSPEVTSTLAGSTNCPGTRRHGTENIAGVFMVLDLSIPFADDPGQECRGPFVGRVR